MAEAVAMFPVGGRRMAEATIFGSYSVDAITNVVVGAGWFSSANEPADVLFGLDLAHRPAARPADVALSRGRLRFPRDDDVLT